MPTTLFIHQNAKELTESVLLKNDLTLEYGGFLLGNNNELCIPFFYPNTSESKTNTFSMPQNYGVFLEFEKKLFSLNLEVFFHTHPHHVIPSQADLNHSFKTDIEILIMYDATRKSFSWRSYNKNGEEQYLQFIDKTFSITQQMFAQSINLTNLGSCFLTESNELLSSNPFAKAFLSVDEDTFNLYRILQKKLPYRNPTKKEVMEKLGITSITRYNRAINRLRENGLIKE